MSTEQNRRHGDLFLEKPLRPSRRKNPSFTASNANRVQAAAHLIGIIVGIVIMVVAVGLILLAGIKLGVILWRL